MLIALLAVLGVDLIVVVLGSVLSRRRWVMRQPGAFHGAIRAAGGEVDSTELLLGPYREPANVAAESVVR
jgi:hypothetical protein